MAKENATIEVYLSYAVCVCMLGGFCINACAKNDSFDESYINSQTAIIKRNWYLFSEV